MGAMPTSLRREHTYYGDLFKARRVLEKWRSELETRPSQQDTRMAAWKWDVEMKELVTDTSTELESLLRSKWLFDCILPGGKHPRKNVPLYCEYMCLLVLM